MGFKENIDELFRELGIKNHKQFAQAIGISPQQFSNYYNGITNPGNKFYSKLRESHPEINEMFLRTGKGKPYNTIESTSNHLLHKYTKKLDLYDGATCGLPAEHWQIIEKMTLELEVISQFHNPFLVKAHGQSMAQTINQGDVLIAHEIPERITKSNMRTYIKEDHCYLVSFEATPDTAKGCIKRIRFMDNDKLILSSDNNRNFPPFIVELNKIHKIYPIHNEFIRKLK